MKKYSILLASLFFASFAMQSCLDFDDPGDEFGLGDIKLENKTEDDEGGPGKPEGYDNLVKETTKADVISKKSAANGAPIVTVTEKTTDENGKENVVEREVEVTESLVDEAIMALDVQFRQAMGGRYSIRGGKEAAYPGAHAYQRQYSLGPDCYEQYFVVPHRDFMYGTLTSTYDISADFNGGPLGAYSMTKNTIIPLLNNPMIDYLPEIKAINLLFYCLVAQENADLSGPFTYFEDKKDVEDPRVYNNVRSIYYAIVKNIDDIVECLNGYENRPEWYKARIGDILANYHDTNPKFYYEGDMGFSTYIKLANSLKLRMAMHIVKVEPSTAKEWAESAVAGGVIDSTFDQQGLYPMFLGFGHPLVDICNTWGDLVMSASFESLLMSLGHPYTEYVFMKNNNVIRNEIEGTALPADSRICGLLAGTMVGLGQDYSINQLQAFSKLNTETFGNAMSPLYFIKWSEVDFLRAEGALRGWSMGGSAQEFYERGIRNGYIEDPLFASMFPYEAMIEEYIQRENANDYTYQDPTGKRADYPSVTKIGVKWNDNDTKEVKLEKIITQKYLAIFPLSTEAWTEMRRTGYPKVFPVLNPDDGDGSIAKGEMIRRIPWVPTDPRIQGIVNQYGLPALGDADLQATRLWWDVDKANF